MNTFKSYHPAISFIYFAVTIIFSILTLNPTLIIISFSGAAFYLCMLEGIGESFASLGFYIPLLLLITILNPVFSHNGETVLFFLNDRRVTLESILYALAAGGSLIAVIYWFKSFGEVVTSDKFIYIFGRIIPKLSLLLSMAIRFVPLLKRKAKEIRAAQKTLGLYSTHSLSDKLSGSMAVFSTLITWALESSIDTAASMKARGYSLPRRTSFSLFKFDSRDGLFAGIMLIITVIMSVLFVGGKYAFSYYPYISYPVQNPLMYIPVAILSFLPFLIEIKEELKWKYSISKI